MHGRLKVRTPEEQQEAIRKEQAKKLAFFRSTFDDITSKRSASDSSIETLRQVEILLTHNSDLYTLWNYRREILLKHFEKSESDAEIDGICRYELSLTENCLTKDPKSYGTWLHRRWVLEHMKTPNWGREIDNCDKVLRLDERNFHCWDYRRYIVQKGGIPLEKELEFSTELIKRNFSNYSSWHYRTTLLPVLYPEKIPEAQIKEDLNLVLNAVFTDPSDQSAWFYSGFLVDQMKKGEYAELITKLEENVKELLEEEPSNEWVLHGAVKLILAIRDVLTEEDKGLIRGALDKLRELDPLRRGYYDALSVKAD